MVDINTFRLEKDANRHPFLVAEEKFNYHSAAITCPEEAVEITNKLFRLDKLAEEEVILFSLDAACKLLAIFRLSHGGVNHSLCGTREVFQRALLTGAVSIIVIHNHPSGDPHPSDTDIMLLKKLEEAGKLMGVSLSDFIIIGDTFYSYKSEGLN